SALIFPKSTGSRVLLAYEHRRGPGIVTRGSMNNMKFSVFPFPLPVTTRVTYGRSTSELQKHFKFHLCCEDQSM
ncbi:hypothetical protein STEG23_023213, partial [Scotinomys teguina]